MGRSKKHKDLGRTKLADILSVLPIAQLLELGPKGSLVAEIRGCQTWNFKKVCKRSGCRFSHSCYFWGGPHRGPNCLTAKQRFMVDRVEKSDTSLLISSVLEIIHNHTYVTPIQMDIIQHSFLYSYDLRDNNLAHRPHALQCCFPRHTVRNA